MKQSRGTRLLPHVLHVRTNLYTVHALEVLYRPIVMFSTVFMSTVMHMAFTLCHLHMCQVSASPHIVVWIYSFGEYRFNPVHDCVRRYPHSDTHIDQGCFQRCVLYIGQADANHRSWKEFSTLLILYSLYPVKLWCG